MKTLEQAIEEQRRLIDDIGLLQKGRRRQRIVNGVLAFLLAGTLTGAGVLTSVVVRLDDTVDQQALDREATRLLTCRARNSAQQAARDDIDSLLNGLLGAFPEAAELIAQLRSGMSTGDLDADCDLDGVISDADYTQT